MTHCPAGVLVVSLQIAQPEAEEIARQVNGQRKVWSEDEQCRPQRARCAKVERRESKAGLARVRRDARDVARARAIEGSRATG